MSGRLSRRLLDVTVAVSAAYILLFLVVAAIRVSYPFEVEWMEGGMLTHAARVLQRAPIYARPSADFVPYFYTPVYPTLLAALSTVTGGLSFPLGRAVSLLATLFTMGVLFRVGQREAGWRYGILGAGLYAALYRTNGAFYDLVRPDALFLALLSGGVYLARYRRGALWMGVAGALFAAGFLTKQVVGVFAPPVALYLLWRGWREALVFAGVAFALSALGVVAYDAATDGWFWKFIFEGHQGHLFYWKNILMEYWRDVLFLAPLLLLLPLLWFGYRVPVTALSLLLAAHWTYAAWFRSRGYGDFPHMYYRELFYVDAHWALFVPPGAIAASLLAYRARNRRIAPRADIFWLLMYVAGVGASALNHSTQWAYANCFMPLTAFGSLLIALATRDLIEAPEGWDGPAPRWAALVPVALLVQFGALYYSPGEQIPTGADRAAAAALREKLAGYDGKLFAPAHPFLAWEHDRHVHVHQMGIQDVKGAKHFEGGVTDLCERLARHEWSVVLTDAEKRDVWVPYVGRFYRVKERLKLGGDDVLRTRTGYRVRPSRIWVPRRRHGAAGDLAPGISGGFEDGTLRGWTATGAAFTDRAATTCSPAHDRVRGPEGWFFASSRRGGARATGRLLSAPFTLERPRLVYRIAGGGRGRVSLRVLVDGEVVARARGAQSDRFKRRHLDLGEWVGRRIRVELVDEDDRPRGDILIDDLRAVEVGGR